MPSASCGCYFDEFRHSGEKFAGMIGRPCAEGYRLQQAIKAAQEAYKAHLKEGINEIQERWEREK